MGIAISHLHVRRGCFIEAAPGRVWEEFTGFERLAAWFGRGHQLEAYEARLGGRVELSVEIAGERRRFGGPVVAFEPGGELSFANNWMQDPWPVPTIVTLRLTPLYDGCLVELFHHGFERLGADAGAEYLAYESGWGTNHLEALKASVEG